MPVSIYRFPERSPSIKKDHVSRIDDFPIKAKITEATRKIWHAFQCRAMTRRNIRPPSPKL
jgi:hypothetical protein